MTDFLEVQALRTFAIGKDVKTKKSDPFPVEAGEAKQLEAMGMVKIGQKVDEPEPEPVKPLTSDPAPSESPPKKKARADAVNEAS